MQTQSTRVRESHLEDEIEVTSMGSEVEVLKEAGMLVSLSVVHMFCVSVLQSLAIRNAWNAIVPSVFGFREISRKEASALRFLFSEITRNSYA